MAVNLSPIWGAGAQLLDNSGNVLSGGKIYTYAAGTTTQVTTYTSNTGVTANSNPIVLNSAGRVPYEIWLTDGTSYKFVLKDMNDVLIGTWDNIVGINSNFVNYVNRQEIQTATAGQTVFNLTTMQYQPGTNSLSVFVDGVNQYGPGAQYAYEETNSSTITFASGLHVGAEVKFTSTQVQNANATDASQISYTPPFSNSVTTNVQAKLAESVNIKDFGTDGAALVNAIATNETVTIPADITTISLSATQSPSVLPKLYKINAEGDLTIELEAGTHTTATGNMMRVGASNANITMQGVLPVETKATSVATITGSAGSWSITYNVVNTSNAAIGDYAKLFDVAPLPILSGDNAASYVLRSYPVLGELYNPTLNVGLCTIANGGGSASFSSVPVGVLSDYIKVGNLLTVKGQTLEVTNVDDGTLTVLVNGAWTNGGVSNTYTFYTTRRSNGVISTSGSSTTVTGVTTLFTSQANIGDVLLANGQMVKITNIASDTSLTVDMPVNFGAGTVFSVLQSSACLHEGVHEITGVGVGTITVLNRSQIEPPINNVSVDEFKIVKTILKQSGTGDGIIFDQIGAMRKLDNVAIVGPGNSVGPIGVLLQNRIPSEVAGDNTTSFGDVTQHGLNGTILLGENVGITQFGRAVMVGHSCDIDARKAALNANLEIGVYVLESGFANLRRTQISSNGSIGLAVNAGGGAVITESRIAGNANDGMRIDANATIYGEGPMFVANVGMNARLMDNGRAHMTDGVSLLSTLSGIYCNGGGGRFDRMVVGANARSGIEAIEIAEIQANDIWISGTSNTAGSGLGIDLNTASTMNGSNIACVGNELYDIYLQNAAQLVALTSYYGSYYGISRVNSPSANGAVIWDGTGVDTGTSTPTATAASGSITSYTNSTFTWTREKNRYMFDGGVTITNSGTASGYLSLTLPFTVVTTTAVSAINGTTGSVCGGYVTGSLLIIYSSALGFPAASGETVRFSGCARVN